MKFADKTYTSGEILQKPKLLENHYGFVLLADVNLVKSHKHDAMVKAMNILGMQGWVCLEMFSKSDTYLYALMYRKPNA